MVLIGLDGSTPYSTCMSRLVESERRYLGTRYMLRIGTCCNCLLTLSVHIVGR